MSRRIRLIPYCLWFAPVLMGQGKITLEEVSGAKLVTHNLHPGSSLTRRWIAIHDAGCPVSIEQIGIHVERQGKGPLFFTAEGAIGTVKDLVAVQLRFVLFDIWGTYLTSLTLERVKDMKGAEIDYIAGDQWMGSDHQIHSFFTSVAFVDQALMKDGTIWRSDVVAIAAKLTEMRLRGFEPSPTLEKLVRPLGKVQ